MPRRAKIVAGASVRRVGRPCTEIPALGATPSPDIVHHMNFYWDVKVAIVDCAIHADEMVGQVRDYLIENGSALAGDVDGVVAGMPPRRAGATNDLRMHQVAL